MRTPCSDGKELPRECTDKIGGVRPRIDLAPPDVLAQLLYTWVKELPQPLLMGDVPSLFSTRCKSLLVDVNNNMQDDLRTSISAEENIYSLLSQLPRLNHDTFRSIIQTLYTAVELGRC